MDEKLRSSSFRMVVMLFADYRMSSSYVLYCCCTDSAWVWILYHVRYQYFKIVLLEPTSFELLYSGFRNPIRACENCKAKRW